MLDILKNWILGITAAAVIAACVKMLGGTRKAGRAAAFAAGLITVFAVIDPLLDVMDKISPGIFGESTAASAEIKADEEAREEQMMKDIIEQKTEAYISDRAAKLGVECRAKVECSPNEDRIPVPYKAKLVSDGEARQCMESIISEEIGIPAERQVWTEVSDNVQNAG